MSSPGGALRDRPVRVLQVLACDDIGGTELMLATLLEHIDGRRVTCDVATLAPPGPIAQRLSSRGFRVLSLGGDGLPTAIRRFAGVVRTGRFDIVNAYGFTAALVARLVVRTLSPRTRFICGVRGLHVTEVEDLDSPKARIATAVERLTSRLVDLYDVNSSGGADFIRSNVGVPPERVVYIPNGLDVDRWALRPPPNGQAAHITCVSRFRPAQAPD